MHRLPQEFHHFRFEMREHLSVAERVVVDCSFVDVPLEAVIGADSTSSGRSGGATTRPDFARDVTIGVEKSLASSYVTALIGMASSERTSCAGRGAGSGSFASPISGQTASRTSSGSTVCKYSSAVPRRRGSSW